MNSLEQLYKTGKTVFSLQDLRVIWREPHAEALRAKIKYYIRTGRFLRLKRGVYAFAKEYNHFELAQTLITPSYISLESALRHQGLLFQFNTAVTCIAGYTRSFNIDWRIYQYHKLRNDVLSSPLGIEREKFYMVASPERAFCDSVYLGYSPSTEESYEWNIGLLKKLVELYNVPRVSGAVSRLLS